VGLAPYFLEASMKRIAIAMLLMSSPVMAETITGPAPDGASNQLPPPPQQAAGVPLPQTGDGAPQEPDTNNPSNQSCSPIGQTLRGELVFPLGCPVAVEYTTGHLQNSNPTGGVTQVMNPDGSVSVTLPAGTLPPSQTSGLPPSQTNGAPPSGFSNVTPQGVTNGNTPPVVNGNK
jgi:hypothetical protein